MERKVLQVNMFGEFTLTYGEKQLISSSRSKVIWNIIAYMLCHRGESVSSENLLSVIWKAEKNDNPSGAMRTAIHRTRSMLSEFIGDEDCKFLIAKSGGYMWNPEVEVSLDKDLFDQKMKELNTADGEENIDTCLEILNLYRGKLLTMLDSELWVIPLQTHYHDHYESVIDRLMPALEREGRFEEGVFLCRRALQIDPYSEKIYQYLMRFFMALDQRQEVVKAYEEMSKLLLEFGVMPDQESRAIYREALHSMKTGIIIAPEEISELLREQEEIRGALVCDYDFFKMLYQSHARSIVRSGNVIHIALLTLKNRNKKEVSQRSLDLAMSSLEKHLAAALRKGDVITRCSATQYLVMLPCANYENSCRVCQRFIYSYERKHPHSPVYIDYVVHGMVPSTRS